MMNCRGKRIAGAGFDALFVTAAALIEVLSVASRHGRPREAIAAYTHPHVLAIDDVGSRECPREDKAAILAAIISEATNCAALLIVLFVPPAVTLGFILRRRRGPAAPRPTE